LSCLRYKTAGRGTRLATSQTWENKSQPKYDKIPKYKREKLKIREARQPFTPSVLYLQGKSGTVLACIKQFRCAESLARSRLCKTGDDVKRLVSVQGGLLTTGEKSLVSGW